MNIRLPLVGTRITQAMGDPNDKIRAVRWAEFFPPSTLPPWKMELVDGSLDLENAEAEFIVSAQLPEDQLLVESLLRQFTLLNLGTGGARQWGNKNYVDLVRNRTIDKDGQITPIPSPQTVRGG